MCLYSVYLDYEMSDDSICTTIFPTKRYKVSGDHIELEVLDRTIQPEIKSRQKKTIFERFTADAKEFSMNTTFHGVRYITYSRSLFRR